VEAEAEVPQRVREAHTAAVIDIRAAVIDIRGGIAITMDLT
jgi:hypothetical protein